METAITEPENIILAAKLAKSQKRFVSYQLLSTNEIFEVVLVEDVDDNFILFNRTLLGMEHVAVFISDIKEFN